MLVNPKEAAQVRERAGFLERESLGFALAHLQTINQAMKQAVLVIGQGWRDLRYCIKPVLTT